MLTKHKDILVENIDSLSYGANQENLKSFEGKAQYAFVKGDITNTRKVKELLRNTDAVVNFAAETHVDRSISDAKPFLNSNTIGAYSILEALRISDSAAKMIQVGTDEEYGDIAQGSSTESDALNPSSPYAATKASASMLVMAYHRTYGLRTMITRCTNNFGPYQFPEKLIPKTIIRAKLDLKIPVYGNGKNIRDWIFVEDHCEAVDRVLQEGRAGEVYNISSGNEVENSEAVLNILELMGRPASLIEYVEDRPGHDLRYSLDSSKIRSQLSWKPKHAFREALMRTVGWYAKNEAWWKPLADERVLHPTPWKLRW
jgi:dTDP-glucose 4,6-dehydratase